MFECRQLEFCPTIFKSGESSRVINTTLALTQNPFSKACLFKIKSLTSRVFLVFFCSASITFLCKIYFVHTYACKYEYLGCNVSLGINKNASPPSSRICSVVRMPVWYLRGWANAKFDRYISVLECCEIFCNKLARYFFLIDVARYFCQGGICPTTSHPSLISNGPSLRSRGQFNWVKNTTTCYRISSLLVFISL